MKLDWSFIKRSERPAPLWCRHGLHWWRRVGFFCDMGQFAPMRVCRCCGVGRTEGFDGRAINFTARMMAQAGGSPRLMKQKREFFRLDLAMGGLAADSTRLELEDWQ